MPVCIYYDSSGNPADPADRVVTLAGVGMRERAIPEFEKMWKGSGLQRFGIDSLHMSALMSQRGDFEGWD